MSEVCRQPDLYKSEMVQSLYFGLFGIACKCNIDTLPV